MDGSVRVTSDDNTPEACIINIGDAANRPTLVNRTEFARTAANFSKINQLYMTDGFAVLGPANPPIDFDFQADTFGSRTSCRPVTGLCGANSTRGARIVYPSDYNFACNASTAGLNMTGNFFSVLSPRNESTGTSDGPTVTDGSDGQKNKGVVPPALFVLGGNTIVGNTYPIGFQYFNDSQKLRQRETPDKSFGYRWEDANDSHLHWAMVWRADFDSSIGSYGARDNPSNASAVGISNVNAGGSQGILSCDTDIVELVSATLFFAQYRALS